MKQKRANDSYPASCLVITAKKAIYARLKSIFRLGTIAYEKQAMHGIADSSTKLFSYVVFSKNAISALIEDESIANTFTESPGLVRYVVTTSGRSSLVSYIHHPGMISYFRSKKMFRELVFTVMKHNWIRACYHRRKQDEIQSVVVEQLIKCVNNVKWEQERRKLVDSQSEKMWNLWKPK